MSEITAKIRFEVMKRDGFRCTYCGRTAQQGAVLHLDHIVPRSKGGSSNPDNLTTACAECNYGKSDNAVLPDGMTDPNPSLTRLWFLSYKPCSCGDPQTHRESHNNISSDRDLHWQGQILGEPVPGYFCVQLYSWFDGLPTYMKLLSIAQFVNEDFEFFGTTFDMRYRIASANGTSDKEFAETEKSIEALDNQINGVKGRR